MALSAEESTELDALLDSSSSIGNVIRDLPHEEPNLVWRSQLNEKLSVLAEKPKRRIGLWKWASGVVVVGAASLAVWSVVNTRTPVIATTNTTIADSTNFEDQLMQSHVESAAAMDVSSAYALDVVSSKETSYTGEEEWSTSDLESL
ncbi:MAG: hypothetical protein JST40_07610 [Armatimonadetes bacterium]|nr:hypothetical protein [Armatimonadota bacterium]